MCMTSSANARLDDDAFKMINQNPGFICYDIQDLVSLDYDQDFFEDENMNINIQGQD